MQTKQILVQEPLLSQMERVMKEDIQRILSEPLPWDKLQGASVLVSGASGMLALPLVRTLLALDGVTVYVMVRNLENAIKKLGCAAKHPALHWLGQDVCKPVTLTSLPGRLDYIVHAASPASPKVYGSDPVGVLLPNTTGTHQLLKLAQEKQSKGFLFFSSGEVYGHLPPEEYPVSETRFGPIDPLSSRACYAESKRLGETLCRSWQVQYGLPVTIVRPFHTFGPGMNLDDGRVFADFVADVVSGRDIVLKSDGAARRAFCYVSDAIAAIFTAWLAGEHGSAYNIGNDEHVLSVRELAERLVMLFPEKGLHVRCELAGHTDGYVTGAAPSSCPDLSKIRALGWSPRVSVEEGFLRTVQALETKLNSKEASR